MDDDLKVEGTSKDIDYSKIKYLKLSEVLPDWREKTLDQSRP